jgi:hypothetical protein
VAAPITVISQPINNTLPAVVTVPGGVTIAMPANTLAQPITMTISQYPAASAPINTGALQVSFMPSVYLIDSQGQEPQTNMSVTITLPYDPSAIPSGYTANDLTISYYDGTQWVVLTPVLDSVNQTLTVVTNHFSWWAVTVRLRSPQAGAHPVVYPNPARGNQVHLAFPSLTSPTDVQVQIWTLSYRRVQDLTFHQVQPGLDVTLDLLDKSGATLSNGLYYLAVTPSGQGRSTLKLMVTR